MRCLTAAGFHFPIRASCSVRYDWSRIVLWHHSTHLAQPVLSGKRNIAKNMAFVLLFQSLAFLVGPILSGTIAEQVGLFEIYLFSSLMSFMIVLSV